MNMWGERARVHEKQRGWKLPEGPDRSHIPLWDKILQGMLIAYIILASSLVIGSLVLQW
jgi:hypothetical protein